MTSSDEFWKLEHLSNTQLIEGLGNVLRTKRQALAALVAHATRCKVAALCGGRRVAPRRKAGVGTQSVPPQSPCLRVAVRKSAPAVPICACIAGVASP